MTRRAETTRHLQTLAQHYREALSVVPKQLPALVEMFRKVRSRNGTLWCAGNGGSAAIASHIATDLTKSAGVRAATFHDPDLLTCFANDFGWERWLEAALRAYAKPSDAVLLISSSGQSADLIVAAFYAKRQGLPLATLTGFDEDNLLGEGANVSLWVNSRSYNVVEAVHLIWLLMACDVLGYTRGLDVAAKTI